MKKILSIILIASVMLLSGCELGTGGKAIVTIGGVSYLPVYQCEPSFKGVVNYIPSTEECPKYDWSPLNYARASCGAIKDEAEGGTLCGTKNKEHSLLGYLKPVQNGQCGAGQIKIIECLTKKSATVGASTIRRKTEVFNNNYLSTEQTGCIEGDKIKDVGCAEATQKEGTKKVYLCTPQLHLDLPKKARYNYFASHSNYCGGWGANTKVDLGYWIQPTIATAPTAPIAQMPSLTGCAQIKAINTDLKDKIAKLGEENALMEQQLNAMGGQ